jgi:hypothetical protein
MKLEPPSLQNPEELSAAEVGLWVNENDENGR